MVAVIHNDGWAVSNKARADTAFDGVRHYATIVIEDLYNAVGLVADKMDVDVYFFDNKKYRSVTGKVFRAGEKLTTIYITGEALGLKNRIENIIKNG